MTWSNIVGYFSREGTFKEERMMALQTGEWLLNLNSSIRIEMIFPVRFLQFMMTFSEMDS